jgi:glutamyl/glutaminyl-tRNA synthetase
MNSNFEAPKKISKRLIQFLPKIIAMKENGYTDNEILEYLSTQNLEIKKSTYKKYLYRNKLKNKKNQNEANSSANTKANMLNSIVNDSAIKDNSISENPVSSQKIRKPSELAQTAFGSPEHKAEVQSETEKHFRNSSLKVGLGLNRGNKT